MDSKENEKRIVEAFRKGTYKWRTARGLSKDSKVSIQDVIDFLDSSDLVIKAKKSNSKGQPLFALKEVYEEKTPLGTRLLSAIINKIIE